MDPLNQLIRHLLSGIEGVQGTPPPGDNVCGYWLFRPNDIILQMDGMVIMVEAAGHNSLLHATSSFHSMA